MDVFNAQLFLLEGLMQQKNEKHVTNLGLKQLRITTHRRKNQRSEAKLELTSDVGVEREAAK